ncbi:AAA domain-containing protein [Micromonospora sp. LOL_015]|uniref:AAA domain-containing protein n=1 Tax=Micromonospora sp. LOL_015 TaxID=3345416 RepID=UPI003A89647F
MTDTLDRHGLDDRLDVRRVSAFDLAAASAPVTWLDEHRRCVPQLIEFAARRFYADRFAVITRHPANESIDVIAVRQVVSAATVDGVNTAGVTATVEVVRELATSGRSQISVVTPFRAQADALEAALVAEFPVERIEELGLRVGTEHTIQGGAADTVVASFAATDDDPPARLRFLADPHLFNVLITRARRQLVVVTSLTAADGLVRKSLRYARQPPPAVPCGGVATTAGVSGWAEQLGARLTENGGVVRFDYPVGRWTVDICLGVGADTVGLNRVVHPDGPQAHLARQRALRRAGWALVDAFASRWNGDPVRAALEILAGQRAAIGSRQPLPRSGADSPCHRRRGRCRCPRRTGENDVALSESGPAPARPPLGTTPADVQFCRRVGRVSVAILVAGGGKWSRVGRDGGAGRARRPRGMRHRECRSWARGVGPCFSAPILRAWTKRAG